MFWIERDDEIGEPRLAAKVSIGANQEAESAGWKIAP
jgi:hypothetical protein